MKDHILKYISKNNGVDLVDLYNIFSAHTLALDLMAEVEELINEEKIELIIGKGFIIKQ